MKIKKLFLGLMLALLTLVFTGCTFTDKPAEEEPETTTHTVVFLVDGERYKTLKVEDGQKITTTVDDPHKVDHEFLGWKLEGEIVDISTVTVSKNLEFVAEFKENKMEIDETLEVNAEKEEGKSYTLVIGWWECTDVLEDGSPKYTSYLDERQVRMFYMNAKLYLEALGLSAAEIGNVQFRNYSSLKVAGMVEAVKADGDVDILIGVGNNVNSSGNLSLLNGNEGKCDVTMGTTPTTRKVAILNYAEDNEVAISLYEWIKNTEVGKKAFATLLEASEVEVYVESINLTVIVHGLFGEEETTVLTDKETAVTIPNIDIDEDEEFLGWALEEDGEVVLPVAVDAELKYDQLKNFAVEGKVDLYPIVRLIPQENGELSIYLHASASKTTYITEDEIDAFEAALKNILSEDESYSLVVITGQNGATFNATVKEALETENVDLVIGGNTIATAEDALVSEVVDIADGHFAYGTRKAAILPSATNKELAQKVINYLSKTPGEPEEPEIETLVVYVHLSASKTTYITDDEFAALSAYLKGLEDDTHKIEINSVAKVNGAGFNEAVKAVIDGGKQVNITIGGATMQSTSPSLCAEDDIFAVGAGYFANDSRKVAAVSVTTEFAETVLGVLKAEMNAE